jgi:hypothetical protein
LILKFKKIDCVIFKLDYCVACETLQSFVNEILNDDSNNRLQQRLNIHIWRHGDLCTFSPAALVRPRLLPTLIAYKNDIATLGWEGFAAMEPHEIQAEIVLDVLEQAAALAD